MKKRSGATFSEVMMLLLIFAILAAIVYPIFAPYPTHKERQTLCLSNMKQISHAALQYAQDYDGRLPDSNLKTAPVLSAAWVEQTALYSKANTIYHCPSDYTGQRSDYSKPVSTGQHASSYSLNKWTTFGLKIADMTDPAAFVLLAERNNDSQAPYAPYLFAGWNWQKNNGISTPRRMARGQEIQAAKVLALRRHSGGAVWAFADGHAKWRKSQEICEEGMFRP